MRTVHRTYCDVLQEMRNILEKTTEYNHEVSVQILASLVEELQVYGNRMEAGLYYQADIEKLHRKRNELSSDIEELHREVRGASRLEQALQLNVK